MLDSDADRTRRNHLKRLLGAGLFTAIAGCSSVDDDADLTETVSDTETADSSTETPADTSTNTPKPTETSEPTPTATPDQPPELATITAEPVDNGQALQYHVVAEDDNGLQYVAVMYGGQTEKWEDIGRRIDKSGELTDLEQPEQGQVVFVARDSTGQKTQAEVHPDEEPPTLKDFHVQPTDNAGEVHLLFKSDDNKGLEQLEIRLNENLQLQQDVSGKTEVTKDTAFDISDAAKLGEANTLTATLEDWNGNQIEIDVDTYIRKFNKMDSPELSVGVEYLTWAGDKFGKCFSEDTDPEPIIGHYDVPMAPSVVSRHIDQMNSTGIQRLYYVFNGTENVANQLESLLGSELIDEIEIGAEYSVKDYRWFAGDVLEWKDENPSISEEIIPEDMGFLRQKILSRENALTYDGKPVFKIWNAARIPWSDKYHERVLESYGSYEKFIEHIRSELTVNGKEPFMIAGVVGGIFQHQGADIPDNSQKMLSEFDATTTWVAGGAWGDDNRATWDEVTEYVEQNYRGHREFTDRHDMEFIPMIFPGFDDRGNTCWGKDRYTPRSLDGFEHLLQLADEYRTTKMVDIATWNDWTEGTQIEPGNFRGVDYGTDYLDVVKEFQQS